MSGKIGPKADNPKFQLKINTPLPAEVLLVAQADKQYIVPKFVLGKRVKTLSLLRRSANKK
jgi:hypothetical protein